MWALDTVEYDSSDWKSVQNKRKSAVSAPDCRTVPATASVKESKDGRLSTSAPDLGNFCSSVYGLEAHSCTRWSL